MTFDSVSILQHDRHAVFTPSQQSKQQLEVILAFAWGSFKKKNLSEIPLFISLSSLSS